MKITIDLPTNFSKILNLSEKDISLFLKTYLALYFYEKGKLSFGKARELSDLSVWEFMEKLNENKIPFRYDVEDLKEDLKVINEL